VKNIKHPRTILFGQIGLAYMLIDIGMPKAPQFGIKLPK